MGSIKKAFKKVFHSSSSSGGDAATPAPDLGTAGDADTTNTTEAESEKQQLVKGKKRGKKSLKINMASNSSGRNIV